jgi:hypothetical protein
MEELTKESSRLEFLFPIMIANRMIRTNSAGPECERKWFRKPHGWETQRKTPTYLYQQCAFCSDRKMIRLAEGFDEPRARGWEDIGVVKQNEN